MSDTNSRFTPQHVLDVVHAFAPIAFDPCTTPENPVGATCWLTQADDGLELSWLHCGAANGLTFCNPPYGRGQLARWAAKMKGVGALGAEVIGLVPSDMSTQWMRLLLSSCTAIAFWNQRIAFGTPDGKYEAGAKFGNAFVYYGERQGRFKRVFSPHSHVLVLR